MDTYDYLSNILLVKPELLERLDSEMSQRLGTSGVMEVFAEKNKQEVARVTQLLGVSGECGSPVRDALREVAHTHEKQLAAYLESMEGENEFERAARFAKKVAHVGKGFFLKKKFGEEILRKRKPENLLAFLHLSSVDELLAQHDVTEIFSALRFMESEEWMHETFEEAYSNFTADDFEEREIEIRVLGPEWREVGEKYVEKKRHNVSHLKEFGVIFLNPIASDVVGKFLRDSALLLHYLHEIEFYAKLFRKYSTQEDFAERFKALLRGDVPEIGELNPGEWLVVQRYLIKENPDDPRLFVPRVNPESIHWWRGVRDLVRFSEKTDGLDLDFWKDLHWVGCRSSDEAAIGEARIVSFEFEDNAMGLAAHSEGSNTVYSYHHREAMWTELFKVYAGGEEHMEQLVLDNYENKHVQF